MNSPQRVYKYRSDCIHVINYGCGPKERTHSGDDLSAFVAGNGISHCDNISDVTGWPGITGPWFLIRQLL
jgi:hypothetical protein